MLPAGRAVKSERYSLLPLGFYSSQQRLLGCRSGLILSIQRVTVSQPVSQQTPMAETHTRTYAHWVVAVLTLSPRLQHCCEVKSEGRRDILKKFGAQDSDLCPTPLSAQTTQAYYSESLEFSSFFVLYGAFSGNVYSLPELCFKVDRALCQPCSALLLRCPDWVLISDSVCKMNNMIWEY